ncbi:MAG: hypothetical protein FJW14_11255, partial [Acidimicrobiia bacterium]|nr:hypothetical protein [Acidimicrobiia bacterium]
MTLLSLLVWAPLQAGTGPAPPPAAPLAPVMLQQGVPQQSAPPPDALLVVIRSQYRRLPFPQDIRRIAVADTDILTAELVTSREVLVLGRETGRTTLIVWF